MKLDVISLQSFLKTIEESGANNPDDRLRKAASSFWGADMKDIQNMLSSYTAILNSAENLLLWTYTKATTEDPKFNMKSLLMIIQQVLAFKQGQMSAASSSSAPPPAPPSGDQTLDNLAGSLGNMNMGN
jgi:hypothetical protein